MDYKALGKNIKSARKARGLTQEMLAERIDISPVFVSQVEGGVRKPSLETVYNLAKTLNVTTDQLLDNTEKSISNSKREEFDMLLKGRTSEEINMIFDMSKELLNHVNKNKIIKGI